ncbi:MAG TPA: biotin-dependent carboxyltransferase family protein [Jatrophihabitantaceae bacterium]|jgi:biotin-dependent carboxylase-like uncharacterized protein|nr:biotin-dependent carboxyltransferase family protein [Jatrophihabitantaceae bacterium]
MIQIVEAGPWASIQDGGRPGYAHLGVGRSGAFDQPALRLANRLVGNPPDAAAIEITLGGLELLVRDAVTVALTGAPCAGLDWGTPTTVPAGTRIRLATPSSGLRSYLALRGGVDCASTLGSRSTDVLGGLGPAPLRAGDLLPVGAPPDCGVSESAAVPVKLPTTQLPATIRILPGPRDDWFAPGALTQLLQTDWLVRADSDRIGIRLDGPPLERVRGGELPSEATLPGALQVPPDGRPILLGPDSPVTGGYPVIAVALAGGLGIAAQLRPGDRLGFR